MFQEIVEHMRSKHTALALITTKIKVVAPTKMKVLGMDWRIYLDSKFPARVDLEVRVRCLHRPQSVFFFFELAVLRATFQSNSCIEINIDLAVPELYCLAFIIPYVKRTGRGTGVPFPIRSVKEIVAQTMVKLF